MSVKAPPPAKAKVGGFIIIDSNDKPLTNISGYCSSVIRLQCVKRRRGGAPGHTSIQRTHVASRTYHKSHTSQITHITSNKRHKSHSSQITLLKNHTHHKSHTSQITHSANHTHHKSHTSHITHITNHTHHKSHTASSLTPMTQLTLLENQIIEVTKEDDSGWWQVGTKPKTSYKWQAFKQLFHLMKTSRVSGTKFLNNCEN
jgi:hypothetical protein